MAAPKRTSAEPADLRLRLPCEPTSIPQARARIRDWVCRHARVQRDLIADIQLAVTEAATNAVRHSGCDDFEVQGWISDDATLTVAVWDHGPGRQGADPGLGLGTQIISELAASVDYEQTEPGTRVTMRFSGDG